MTKPRKPTAEELERAQAVRDAVEKQPAERERRPGIRGPIRDDKPEREKP